MVKKILSILITPVFYTVFGGLLVFFHPIQMLCYHLGGYGPHKWSVEMLNIGIMRSLIFLGSYARIRGIDKLPVGRPLIIISNHQSMFDIPPVVWGFRKHHAKFISKKELGSGIPSISYNLRKSGALLIDRKKGKEAVAQIGEWAKKIHDLGRSVLIYPEGTRSKDGRLKEFKTGGIQALVENMPDALVVPFVIDGNWKIFRSGAFPLEIGHKLTYTALEPIEPSKYTPEQLAEAVRKKIQEKTS